MYDWRKTDNTLATIANDKTRQETTGPQNVPVKTLEVACCYLFTVFTSPRAVRHINRSGSTKPLHWSCDQLSWSVTTERGGGGGCWRSTWGRCADVYVFVRVCLSGRETKSRTIKTPERFVYIGNTSGVFQSRLLLLAQPLIRLSSFKPLLGDDAIEFTGETKMESEKGEGQKSVSVCVCVCVCVYSPKQGK